MSDAYKQLDTLSVSSLAPALRYASSLAISHSCRVRAVSGGNLPTTDALIDAALAPGGMVEGLLDLQSQGDLLSGYSVHC